jgi:ADP-heptose:LPS heptosyltransferase
MAYDPRAILVVDVVPFGKSLLMLPALQALRDKYPESFISVAAAKGLGDLLSASNLVDETVDLGIIKPTEQSYGSAIKRLFRLVTKPRREYDWAIDFSPRLETQIASRLSWRTRHITPSRITNLIDMFIRRDGARLDDHLAECVSTLKKVGITKIEPRFALALPNEESLRFEDMVFGKDARHGEPIVVFYSAQASGADSWGSEKFIETAHRLFHNFKARIVVVDEPFSSEFTKALKALLPVKSAVLTAPTALQFAAAIARSSLVITDERGVAKMATDFDAPVIEIAASSSAYAPEPSARVIVSSSPSRVTTEAVFEAASELIQAGRTATLLKR